MQIHATNINGLGATQVVKSFLDASSDLGFLDSSNIYLPSTGPLCDYFPGNGRIKRFKRVLPNSISRLLECLFSRFFFPNVKTIVLGDIPLRGIKDQIVLVHQSNLIYPRVNPNSSRSINFKLSRLLFLINNKYASTIIVQTGAIANDLVKSYPSIKNKIVISPQPVPNWLNKNLVKPKTKSNDKIRLFYPAAYYPHKKHSFLKSISEYLDLNAINFSGIEILVTLKKEDFQDLAFIPFLKNLGQLSSEEMNSLYQEVDALLFLSSMESYGLPLIEAVSLNLPIITVDFSYSRWVCEDAAYYFEPYSVNSFMEALDNFKNNHITETHPDYIRLLDKFPNSWDVIAKTFFNS